MTKLSYVLVYDVILDAYTENNKQNIQRPSIVLYLFYIHYYIFRVNAQRIHFNDYNNNIVFFYHIVFSYCFIGYDPRALWACDNLIFSVANKQVFK